MPIHVFPGPDIDFEVSDTSGCRPLSVKFTNLNPDNTDCFWDFGNNQHTGGCDPAPVSYDTPGCYDVTLTQKSPNGCSGSRTKKDLICVHPIPKASFEFDPEELDIYNPKTRLINTSTGATSFEWNLDSLDTLTGSAMDYEFPANETGTYRVCLKAVNDQGCRDSTCKKIAVSDVLSVYVPNSFTPDGDGINEVFRPILRGHNPEEYQFWIFNRWGDVIFQTEDPLKGWNGKQNGELVRSGVYVWKLRVSPEGSTEQVERKGSVTLIR